MRMTTIGEKIRASRLSAGLTQVQLGALLGKDSALVSKWERDEVTPSSKSLFAVARALGKTVLDFEENHAPSVTESSPDGE